MCVFGLQGGGAHAGGGLKSLRWLNQHRLQDIMMQGTLRNEVSFTFPSSGYYRGGCIRVLKLWMDVAERQYRIQLGALALNMEASIKSLPNPTVPDVFYSNAVAISRLSRRQSSL